MAKKPTQKNSATTRDKMIEFADQMETAYLTASVTAGQNPDDIEWFRHYVWSVLAGIIREL